MANNVSSSNQESYNTTPSPTEQNTSKTAIEVHIPPAEDPFPDYDHLDDPPAKSSFTAYDRLEPPVDSPYAVLGNIEEVDLTSFAYQIASGMVGHTEPPHGSGNEFYLDKTNLKLNCSLRLSHMS